MKLSAEQYAELLATFQPSNTEAGRFDRRRAARVELESQITIVPVVNGHRMDPVSVIVCDFSARGASFLHNAEVAHGQQYVVELPRRSGGMASLLCTAIRCTSVTPKVFRIGVEFECILQESPRDLARDVKDAKRIRETILK